MRLGLLLALAAFGLVWLVWMTAARAERIERDRLWSAEVERRRDRIRDEIERAGREVEAALAGVAAAFEEGSPTAARLLAGGPEALDVAREWSEALGLDRLTVLDGAGRVLSSAHWPEQAGLLEPAAAQLEPGTSSVIELGSHERARVVVASSRQLASTSTRGDVFVVGGRVLDEEWLSRLGGPSWLFAPGSNRNGARIASTAAGDVEAAAELTSAASALASGPSDASEPDSVWRLIAERWPNGEGRSVALVAAVARPPVGASLQHRGSTVFALACAAGVGGAIGGWAIGRRMERPLEQLVQAVEAIGAGRADYRFPRDRSGGYEALASAFSRMQRALEQQQRRSIAAEKVAAWREVAQHVAHEVKNPLMPIRLTVENLQRARRSGAAPFDELFDDGARTILEEVEQLQGLVGEFSEFARLPVPELRRIALEPLVAGVLDLYRAEPGLEIRESYPGVETWIEADAGQLGRALKNVVGNAIEAMRESGAERRRLDVSVSVEEAAAVVRVRDWGPGLSPEAGRRLMSTPFTTKEHGSGLGLAITRRILTDHGAKLELSRAGPGTLAELRLPRADEGPPNA